MHHQNLINKEWDTKRGGGQNLTLEKTLTKLKLGRPSLLLTRSLQISTGGASHQVNSWRCKPKVASLCEQWFPSKYMRDNKVHIFLTLT